MSSRRKKQVHFHTEYCLSFIFRIMIVYIRLLRDLFHEGINLGDGVIFSVKLNGSRAQFD